MHVFVSVLCSIQFNSLSVISESKFKEVLRKLRRNSEVADMKV